MEVCKCLLVYACNPVFVLVILYKGEIMNGINPLVTA